MTILGLNILVGNGTWNGIPLSFVSSGILFSRMALILIRCDRLHSEEGGWRDEEDKGTKTYQAESVK